MREEAAVSALGQEDLNVSRERDTASRGATLEKPGRCVFKNERDSGYNHGEYPCIVALLRDF